MAKGNILSEADVDYLEERFKDVFATKEDFTKYRSNLFDKLDKILKEILASRQEQTVLSGHVKELFDRVETLEEGTTQ